MQEVFDRDLKFNLMLNPIDSSLKIPEAKSHAAQRHLARMIFPPSSKIGCENIHFFLARKYDSSIFVVLHFWLILYLYSMPKNNCKQIARAKTQTISVCLNILVDSIIISSPIIIMCVVPDFFIIDKMQESPLRFKTTGESVAQCLL